MLRHRKRTVELPAEAIEAARQEDMAADPEEIRRRALAYLEDESGAPYDSSSYDSEPYDSSYYDDAPYDTDPDGPGGMGYEGTEPFDEETKYHTAHALYQDELEQEAMAYLNSETRELYNTRSFTQSLDEADFIGADLPEGPLHPSQRKRSDRVYDEVTPPAPRKKHKKKHYFLRFLVFVGIVGGCIGILFSPLFTLETITVEGNVNYKAEKIIEMSGLETGKNMFRIHRNRVRDRLLEDSYIDSAKIRRELPHTMSIVITERQELACVPMGKQYVVIDKEGYVLKVAKKAPRVTLVRGIKVAEAEPGSHLKVEEESEDTFQETLELLNAMQYSNLFFKKIVIKDTVIRAYVYDKLLCKGTPEAVLENIKNGNLQKILYDLTKKKITKGTIYLNKGKYCSFSPVVE